MSEFRDTRSLSEWTEMIAAVCAAHSLPSDALRMFERGSDIVFDVGGEYVVKLTEPKWAYQINSEWVFLRGVRGKLPVETAEPVARGDLDGWPYIVTSQLRGTHLDAVWPQLAHAQRIDIAEQIGRLARTLHTTRVGGLDAPEWGAFMAQQLAGARAHHAARGASEPWLDAMDSFLNGNDPYFEDAPLVCMHTEILGEHLLVDGTTLCGMLDFADGKAGPAEYEIAAPVEFLFHAEADLFAAFMAAYGWSRPLDEAECGRLLRCALLHEFASLPRMLRAAGDGVNDFETLRARLYPHSV